LALNASATWVYPLGSDDCPNAAYGELLSLRNLAS
jgi:hypothetical protein